MANAIRTLLSSRDASQLDMAGAQRMLSQKMVKEALLAAQGVGAAGDVESLKSLTGRFRLEA
nr:type IV pili methyl-accepting chemotaxis transducer N-terminal domain-containing protein [Pseudomonas sp. KSR10]